MWLQNLAARQHVVLKVCLLLARSVSGHLEGESLVLSGHLEGEGLAAAGAAVVMTNCLSEGGSFSADMPHLAWCRQPRCCCLRTSAVWCASARAPALPRRRHAPAVLKFMIYAQSHDKHVRGVLACRSSEPSQVHRHKRQTLGSGMPWCSVHDRAHRARQRLSQYKESEVISMLAREGPMA